MEKKSKKSSKASKIPFVPTKRQRLAQHKDHIEFAHYLMGNMKRNNADARRWLSFSKFGASLVVHVFDLDINPSAPICVCSIMSGVGTIVSLPDRATVDFNSMNVADMKYNADTGKLPKGFYG